MNILYVEDDLLDADLTRRELLKASPDFHLEVVRTRRDAISCLEQSSFDVVLADMRLPDGDGLAVLGFIRERAWPAAVILVTGSGDEEIAVAALKAGADDYVVKRAGYLEHLPTMIQNVVERHRAETARRSRSLHVLYAEDNAADIELTRHHLERHAPHIRLEVVSTAAAVLDRLRPGAAPEVDVLLLDYLLPGASALELLGMLRRGGESDIPVVLVTGQGNEEIAVQALRLGAADYVVKTAEYLPKLPWALESAFHRAQLVREQSALRESEARYRVISELMSDIMYSFRIGSQRELEVEWSAGALRRITGYTVEELAASGWQAKVIHADDLPIFNRHLETVLAGRSDVAEFRVVAKDGAIHWLRNFARPVWDESAACVVRVYGAGQDITEHKLAEGEIQKLNQGLQRRARELSALNQAGRAITSTLDLEAVLKLVIDEVKNLMDVEGASVLLRDPISGELVFAASTGARSEALLGKRFPITAGIAGWVVRERRPAIVADAQTDPRFYSSIDSMTGLTTRSVVAVPLMFGGAVWGVAEAINRTLTAFDEHDLDTLEALASFAAIAIQNAQLYSSLQEANTRLQTAMQAKDEMIRNVSHELRTPLGLMYGYIGLLDDRELGALTSQQERAVQVLRKQGDRLRFMVERLLTLQSLDAERMQWEHLDLSEWLPQVMLPWETRVAKAGIRLQVQVVAGLPQLVADSIFLGQVVENLLDNAVKFSPRGSEVRVCAWAEDNQIILAVSDNGIGIPPDKLQQIFERFFQVDGSSTRKFGGMGIGLALCRAIVEAHGGTIWADSEGRGKGSTFYVSLPISKA